MSSLEITYNSFIGRISDVSKKDILFRLTKAVIISIPAFIILSIILISAEVIFGFNSSIRTVFFFGYFSALFATITTSLVIAFIRLNESRNTSSVKKYARSIGSFFPEIKDNLLNAVQIYGYTRRKDHIFSTDLVTGSIRQVNEIIKPYDFRKVISFKQLAKQTLLAAASVILFAVLLFSVPGFLQASNRLIDYNYTFVENSLGIAYDVKPGNIEIPKGGSAAVNTKINFTDPDYTTESIKLFTKTVTADGLEISTANEDLKASDRNQFSAEIKNINSSTIYWFEYKGIKSSSYTISITSKPVIKTTKITVYPPAYTKLPSREITGSEIVAITGSKIYVSVESSDVLSNSYLQFSWGNNLKIESSDKNATGTFSASANGTFKILLENEKGLTNQNAPEYTMRIIPDEYPKISIIEPDNGISIQGTKDVTLRSRISDDFGFTKMRMGYKISKTSFGEPDKDFRYSDIPLKNTDATGVEVPYVWSLTSLNLGTDDEVEYFVEVYDNDGISGPKMTRSETRTLVYPSLEALFNKTEKTKEEIEKSLNDVYEDAMELKKELDEIKEKMETNPEELGINDQKKNEELQQKIDNIQNQFSDTQQKLEDLMKDLQNNSQISKETLEKYMELQKMFQKIDSKELRDMLQKMQEALKNFNKQQFQDAMKNFKFDEEAFRKSLEKTMELLNKIMNEQKFGELTQKLDDITKKQDELKSETEKTDKNDASKMNEESKKQDNIKKDLQDFQKQMKELTDNIKKTDKNDALSKELEKLLKEMMKKQLEQKMDKSTKSLEESKKNESMQQQKELSQDLNDMNDQMQALLEGMLNMENQKMQAKMQEFLNRLKEMSQKEQELKEKSQELDKDSDSKEFEENKIEQDKLKNQLSQLIDEMMSMAQEMGMNPMMSKNLGDAYNDMEKASDQLGKKEGKSANKSQTDAKSNLDKAIERMQQMCKNGQQGKGNKPSSSLQQLLQMLQQMIQRQQGLNQKMEGMQQNGNQGTMTQEQMAEMQRLAMEQETIKKNLQQLNEEFKKEQDKEGKKLLGDLDVVQKDMMEVIKDLQNNNITPETKKRQEKILSRMLDFQLSAREKDFEQRRESRPGKNFDRTSPSEIVISRPNLVNGINQDALILQENNYSEDYETLIQKYMEKMKELK